MAARAAPLSHGSPQQQQPGTQDVYKVCCSVLTGCFGYVMVWLCDVMALDQSLECTCPAFSACFAEILGTFFFFFLVQACRLQHEGGSFGEN
jgi:hypothetical protein